MPGIGTSAQWRGPIPETAFWQRPSALVGIAFALVARLMTFASVREQGRAKAKRKVIADMLAKLQQDLDMAVEKMPEDWDETELQWYLVRRAELLTRTTDRLRRIAYHNALRTGGL